MTNQSIRLFSHLLFYLYCKLASVFAGLHHVKVCHWDEHHEVYCCNHHHRAKRSDSQSHRKGEEE